MRNSGDISCSLGTTKLQYISAKQTRACSVVEPNRGLSESRTPQKWMLARKCIKSSYVCVSVSNARKTITRVPLRKLQSRNLPLFLLSSPLCSRKPHSSPSTEGIIYWLVNELLLLVLLRPTPQRIQPTISRSITWERTGPLTPPVIQALEQDRRKSEFHVELSTEIESYLSPHTQLP